MKKSLFLLAAMGSVSVLSAYYDQQGYGYSSGYYAQPGYSSGYYAQPGYGYSDGSYQGQGYQGGYYQSQPQYYQSQPQYYQTSPQGYSNQPYAPARQQYYNQSSTTYSTPAGNVDVQYQKDGTNAALTSDQEIAKKVHDTISSGWFSKGYKNVSFDVTNGVVALRGSVETMDDKNKIEDSVKKIDGVRQVNNQITVSGEKDSDSSTYQSNYGTNQMRDNRSGYGTNEMRDNRSNYGTNQMRDSRFGYDRSNEMRDNQARTGYQTNDARTQNPYAQDYAATETDRQINEKIRDNLGSGWFGPDYSLVVIKTSNGVVTLIGSVEKLEDAQKAAETVRKVEGVRSVNNQLNINKK